MNHSKSAKHLKVIIGDIEKTVKGRPAWLLEKLVAAGKSGVSTIDLPAGVRTSHYVLQLRRAMIPVETRFEKHAGEFAGRHARYTLSAPVQIMEAA